MICIKRKIFREQLSAAFRQQKSRIFIKINVIEQSIIHKHNEEPAVIFMYPKSRRNWES